MPKFFIDRPIFAWVIAILICLAGIASILRLPIEAYPNIAPPSVVISASYPGASAQVVQQSVTQVIEQQLTGLDHLLYFSSSSSANGSANITVTFQNGTNLDIAAVQVQNRVAVAEPQLPSQVQALGVQVNKANAGFLEVVALRSSNPNIDTYALNNLVASRVLDPIERIPGIGSANQFGSEYAMRIWLNPLKLQGYSLSATDVLNAVEGQNIQTAAGSLGAAPAVPGQALTVTVNGASRFSTPQQFENIILRTNSNGTTVRLKDVARVKLAPYSYGFMSLYNGKPVAGMGLQLLPGANALNVAKAVRAKMDQLQQTFPQGVTWFTPYDSTTFVKVSIDEVVKTLFEAMLLVFLVIYLFLQNLRATLIPSLVVPVALLGTFAGLYIAGFSINILTLFAMVLAIGLVVDDAIVVVENVERHISEEGLAPREATLIAMEQITGAIVAITLVLAAVFIPASLLSGSVGVIYRQFSLTIAIAMLLSAFMALSFTPALCASIIKPNQHENRMLGWFNKLFARTQRGYMTRMRHSVRHTPRWMLLYLVLILGAAWLFTRLPSSFLPEEDQGYALAIVQLPPGATLDRTIAVMGQIKNIVIKNSAVTGMMEIAGFSFVGSGENTGMGFIRLKPWSKRTKPDEQIGPFMAWANHALSGIKGAQIFVVNLPTIRGLSQFGGFDMELEDRAGLGHDKLMQAMATLLAKAHRDPAVTGVRPNMLPPAPQLQMSVDRVQAASMGLSVGGVYTALQLMLAPVFVNDFNYQGRVLRVLIEADAPFRMGPQDLDDFYTASNTGAMVPLSTVVHTKWTMGSPTLTRYNGYGSIEIVGNAAPGYSSGQAMTAMQDIVDHDLPHGIGYEWTGQSYQEVLSGQQAPILYALSMIVVFLALAALYESWSIPIAVLLVVPMGVLGSLLLTWLRGLPDDIYFKVGLIAIIGLSAKNAILIIQFAHELQQKGMGLIAATLEAARLRLRPILMTSIAFILGVLPLAISSGAGANSRHSIGTGVIGGMLGATVIGLLLIPVFYVVVRRLTGDRSDGTEATGEDVIRPFD